MFRTLSSQRNFAAVEREARVLLHELRQAEPEAVKDFYLLDSEAHPGQSRLADAQYIVARRYGYRSWLDLKRRLCADYSN